MPDRHWDHRDWFSDPGKARRELGWSAQTSLADGLRQTMAWMRAHPELVREGERHSVTMVRT